jgi:hypothetical protein
MKAKLNYELMRAYGQSFGFTEDNLGWIDIIEGIEKNNGFVRLIIDSGVLRATNMGYVINKEWIKELIKE